MRARARHPGVVASNVILQREGQAFTLARLRAVAVVRVSVEVERALKVGCQLSEVAHGERGDPHALARAHAQAQPQDAPGDREGEPEREYESE